MVQDKTLSILRACEIDSTANTLKLPPGQLDRAVYEEVDEVLSRIGGKWTKKLKAHQFPYDPTPLLNAVLSSKELPPKNPTAFFPTPKAVVDMLIDVAALRQRFYDVTILEPSAGTGAIVKAVRALKDEDRDWTIHCCECLPINRTVLENEGFEIVADDFMSYKPDLRYSVILMNPPFSLEDDKTAYITHIMHAWGLLEDDWGTLAAVVPAGWTFGSTKKVKAFREFVFDTCHFEEIGSGAFKDSGTMVNTFLIWAEKGDENWRQKPYNGWCSYHAWNASMWIDNDQDSYHALKRIKDRAGFELLCNDVERKMVREQIPVILREADREALWQYYASIES